MFIANAEARVVYACPHRVRLSGRDPTGQPFSANVDPEFRLLTRILHRKIIAGQMKVAHPSLPVTLPSGPYSVAASVYRRMLLGRPYAVCISRLTPAHDLVFERSLS